MVLDCKFLNMSSEKFNKNMRFFAGFRMFCVKCQVQKFSSNSLLFFNTPYACLNNLYATATNANFLVLPLLTNL